MHHAFITLKIYLALQPEEGGGFSLLVGMALCTTRCMQYRKKWEEKGEKPNQTPLLCSAQSPSAYRKSTSFGKYLVSMYPWRCQEI